MHLNPNVHSPVSSQLGAGRGAEAGLVDRVDDDRGQKLSAMRDYGSPER